MTRYQIALFGEAEKGEFCKAYPCQSLSHLLQNFGNPPPESHGLFFAIQSLMYERPLIYFRVHEEGFSIEDYLKGLKVLQEEEEAFSDLFAIGIPGVGDDIIINAVTPICSYYQGTMVITEPDLYDYLTSDAACFS